MKLWLKYYLKVFVGPSVVMFLTLLVIDDFVVTLILTTIIVYTISVNLFDTHNKLDDKLELNYSTYKIAIVMLLILVGVNLINIFIFSKVLLIGWIVMGFTDSRYLDDNYIEKEIK